MRKCVRDQHEGRKLKIPLAARHVWEWFKELDRARAGTGFGVNPLSYTEIYSWSRVRQIALSPWHIDALISMDDMRLMLFAEKKSDEDKGDEKTTVSERPLTTRLFDALFPAKRK
ncbi:phage tail assembly chaperone [Rhizobium favelukesii]|uniref:phage tail assembly chaperone n=1 Tax=Rhizobium favelukesii TaxID=348824 RepID=UPI0021606E12|nr:hypothetical protein [Rhizobium favelukesii]MCS0459538.1 hypothetical protein [Rhizobium favelukesii]